MAWPTNKPDTTKFDNDADSIKESRPELNTMSTAVNDIVDFVSTTGIDNNHFLIYNKSAGRLEVAEFKDNITVESDSAGGPVRISAGGGSVNNPLTADLDTNGNNIIDDNAVRFVAPLVKITNTSVDSGGDLDSVGTLQFEGNGFLIKSDGQSGGAVTNLPTIRAHDSEDSGGGTESKISITAKHTEIGSLGAGMTHTIFSHDQTVLYNQAGIDIANTGSVPRINSSEANRGIIISSDNSNRGQIAIIGGTNGNIEVSPNGTGKILVGNGSNEAVITTSASSAQNLKLETANGNNSGTITINQGSNGNVEIAPNGTGKTKIDNLEYNEAVHTLSYGATITPEPSDGAIQQIKLTGNVAFGGFATETEGASVTLVITQDGTGNRLFTESLDSNGRMLFAGGTSTLSTSADAIDIMTISFIGGIYYASLSTNFS